MSKAWPTVRLGEVLRHRKEFITIDDVTNYKRPRVQLHVQGIVLRDEVPGALIKTKTQQVCRAGEFLVAEIDAKVGGFGIVPESLAGSIVSSHYFLFIIDESKLDRRFLDFFIRTPPFREQVAAQGSTNYAAIRPAHVLGYEMPLPPLAEQRRVVARIEKLAAQIHKARTLRHQATEEAEALILSALTHERCSANQQITGIKFSDEVLPEYGFWWMRGLGKKLMAAAPQATLPIINQSRIGEFEISVPPLAEQRRIVAELDALQAEVDALKPLQAETAAELAALLPALLDRAFKGQLA